MKCTIKSGIKRASKILNCQFNFCIILSWKARWMNKVESKVGLSQSKVGLSVYYFTITTDKKGTKVFTNQEHTGYKIS